MAIQFWKLPFRKSGYPADTIEISTEGKIVGDYILFPRKFFQLSGTSAQYFDKKDNQYKSATIGAEKTNFLMAKNIDEELSLSTGITVYTRLQLKHINVTNTILRIVYQPFGDILDPDDFEQSLNKTADVEHKSLTLSNNLICKNATVLEKIKSYEIEASVGKVDNLFINKVKANEITIGEGKDKLTFQGGFFKIDGKTFPHISPSNLIPANTLTILALSPSNFIELVPINFLKINPTIKDLSIQGKNVLEEITNMKNEIDSLKEEIRILKEGK